MADLKRCDRCSKTVETRAIKEKHGFRPNVWSWLDLTVEFKADLDDKRLELCNDCAKLLLTFLEPNKVAPIVMPPVDGSGETIRMQFKPHGIDLTEPDKGPAMF